MRFKTFRHRSVRGSWVQMSTSEQPTIDIHVSSTRLNFLISPAASPYDKWFGAIFLIWTGAFFSSERRERYRAKALVTMSLWNRPSSDFHFRCFLCKKSQWGESIAMNSEKNSVVVTCPRKTGCLSRGGFMSCLITFMSIFVLTVDSFQSGCRSRLVTLSKPPFFLTDCSRYECEQWRHCSRVLDILIRHCLRGKRWEPNTFMV